MPLLKNVVNNLTFNTNVLCGIYRKSYRNKTMQKSRFRNDKAKENQFIERFRLLNSQETSEEIAWSCSDSSEFEDHVQCEPLSACARRKRKRVNHKKKVSNNHSNLEISIVDTAPERCKPVEIAKSPILAGKSKSESLRNSPILTPSQHYVTRLGRKTTNSTPTSTYNCDQPKVAKGLKSPIILLKHEHKISPKVRKKLFEVDRISESRRVVPRIARSTSPIINHKKNSLDRRKGIKSLNKDENVDSCNQLDQNLNIKDLNNCVNKEQMKEKNDWESVKPIRKETFIESTSSSLSDNVNSIKNSRLNLVAKVKSYFDSYFSSQSSQHSISECETSTQSSSNNADDIEIINSITQVRSVTPSLKDNTTSFESNVDVRPKKVKYKKGGLAYRLNDLLKKQNSSISLWQHERYLAANSSFVIPKEEFLAFRIKSVDFKYSLYLLEVVDSNNVPFLILINSAYVNSNLFSNDDVLKVYEPYRIIDSDDCKIITNVCKFECGKLKF